MTQVILPQLILPVLRSGAAWFLCGLLLCAGPPSLHAQHRFTRLHSIGNPSLVTYPPWSLIDGSDGALYGALEEGGVARLNKDGSGCTRLNRLGGQGVLEVLEGSDGTLYGSSGASIFKINRDGTGYALVRTAASNDFGGVKWGTLLESRDGAIYGTTWGGGAYGRGTVYTFNPNGTGFQVVLSIPGYDDGRSPRGVIEASDGLLYGTSSAGGSNDVGTIFKLNKDGGGYALLHHFSPFEWANGEGWSPRGGLIEGSDGALYGTTYGGGSSNRGTVFKLNKAGTGYLVLRSFAGGPGDGAGPEAGLAEGADGALYGTTPYGGSNDLGTVFKLNKDGSGYCVVASSPADLYFASWPSGWLIEARDGALYGATPYGGETDSGTLFRLEVAPVLYNPVWSGNVFSFQFNARSNVVYQPQFTSSLADVPAALRSAQAGSNWIALPSLTGQRGVVTVTDTNLPASPRFYRVVTP